MAHTSIFFSKKAMGIGEVFVYIIAALTFALIMIFGYKAINQFLEKGQQVEFVQFKTELESSVKKIYSEYGSVREVRYRLPSGYTQVCFVDLDKSYLENCNTLHLTDPVACTVWKQAQDRVGENEIAYDNADENVFLTPPAPVKIKVYKLNIPEGILCIPLTQSSFSLRLKGEGDKTALQIPPPPGQ